MGEMKHSADKRRVKLRYFRVGDRVLVLSVRGESVKWLAGKVIRVKSPTMSLLLKTKCVLYMLIIYDILCFTTEHYIVKYAGHMPSRSPLLRCM